MVKGIANDFRVVTTPVEPTLIATKEDQAQATRNLQQARTEKQQAVERRKEAQTEARQAEDRLQRAREKEREAAAQVSSAQAKQQQTVRSQQLPATGQLISITV